MPDEIPKAKSLTKIKQQLKQGLLLSVRRQSRRQQSLTEQLKSSNQFQERAISCKRLTMVFLSANKLKLQGCTLTTADKAQDSKIGGVFRLDYHRVLHLHVRRSQTVLLDFVHLGLHLDVQGAVLSAEDRDLQQRADVEQDIENALARKP
jgi:hypothetical protein